MSRGTKGADTRQLVSTDLFTLTYGSLVSQLIADIEDIDEVNVQLDRIGYNIGCHLVEDFLVRTNSPRCQDLQEVAEKIKQAFLCYLNVNAEIEGWTAEHDQFSVRLNNNPLARYVELPEKYSSLQYASILCGVIRGALEMVQLSVNVTVTGDELLGAATTELTVQFIEKLCDALPDGDKD